MKWTAPSYEHPTTLDTDPAQAAIRSFLLATVLYALLGIIWGSTYLIIGLTAPAIIPYGYVALVAVVLLVYRTTNSFAITRTVILLSWLVLPLLLQLFLGGFNSGSAAVLWAVAAPIGSLFVAPRQSPIWAGGFVTALLAAWVAEPWLEPVTGISAEVIRTFFALNLTAVGIAVVLIVRDFLLRLQMARQELEFEKAKSDQLLLNVLPVSIAERLKGGEETIADRLDDVSIVFTDLVGFTPLSQDRSPAVIVDLLGEVTADFDRLVETHQMEKIRTAGDGYMAVGGAPESSPDHVQRAADLALDMLETIGKYTDFSGNRLRLRVGIDCGPVIAGVIGLKKFTYDVWGDTVNTASRMESHGVPGKIHVTERVRDRLQDSHRFEDRGLIEIKGKGPMRTFFLIGRQLGTQHAGDSAIHSASNPVLRSDS
jgi:adenylate cyclase